MSNVANLTIVVPYYNNGAMLRRQITEWMSYQNPECLRVVVVDDGSRIEPAESIVRGYTECLDITLLRIIKDIPWNQHGARNLGMSFCSGWCLLTDIDHVLPAIEFNSLLDITLDKDRIYRPRRIDVSGSFIHPHVNSFVLRPETFAAVGGYDEAYTGYYGTDKFFRLRAEEITGTFVSLPISLQVFNTESIADADTTTLSRTRAKYSVNSNPWIKLRSMINPRPGSKHLIAFEWERLI
jgi:hypothetical protein